MQRMKAEHSVAIRAFDYVAAVAFGVVAAAGAWLITPGGLPMPLAMLVGMLVGSVCALPVLGVFTKLLGGFEIVVMSLQIGMIAGMVGGMAVGDGVLGSWAAASGLTGVAAMGASVGVVVQVLLHVTDLRSRGEVDVHE